MNANKIKANTKVKVINSPRARRHMAEVHIVDADLPTLSGATGVIKGRPDFWDCGNVIETVFVTFEMKLGTNSACKEKGVYIPLDCLKLA